MIIETAGCFHSWHLASATMSLLSLVRFGIKDYSVPAAHAHHSVTAIAKIRKVRLIVGDWVVARDTRDRMRETLRNNPL